MVKFEEAGFGIAGEAGESEEVSLRVNFSKGKIAMAVDGEELRTQTEYLQTSGLVVWMGNEDVQLVKGSGGVRRQSINIASATHIRHPLFSGPRHHNGMHHNSMQVSLYC